MEPLPDNHITEPMTRIDPEMNNRTLFPSARECLFAFTAILLLLLVIYGSSFRAPFHYDDYVNIVDNPNIHLRDFSLHSLRNVLYGKKPNHTWDTRPLSYLTFALNYYVGRTDVFGYHAVNFAIHYLSSVLLFFLLHLTLAASFAVRDDPKHVYSLSLLSTIFWATHPIQVTAVTYIVQRMTSMAAMFYLMSMLFFALYRLTAGKRQKIIRLALCILAGILAMLSKENAVMLPVSILLYEMLIIQGPGPNPGPKKRNGAIISLLVIITGMVVLACILTTPSAVFNGYQTRYFTMQERILTEPRVILFYLSLLVYPVSSRFTLLHDIELSRNLLTPWTTLPAIVLVMSIIPAGLYLSRKHPVISFGILFFFLNHLIEGTVIPLELIYEHRNYLPSLFFFPIFIIMIFRLLSRIPGTGTIPVLCFFSGIILLVSQAHTTHMRNYRFLSGVRLWSDNIEKSPALSTPYLNLGRSLWEIGLTEKSMEALNKAEALNRFNNTIQHRTLIFNKALYDAYITRQYRKAGEAFQKALLINNGSPAIWAELSRIHLILGNPEKAMDLAGHALSFWPDNPDLLFVKTMILFKTGRLEPALSEITKMIELYPDHPKYQILMAEIHRGKKDRENP